LLENWFLHRSFFDLEPLTVLCLGFRIWADQASTELDTAFLPHPVIRTWMFSLSCTILGVPLLPVLLIGFLLFGPLLNDPLQDIGVFLVKASITTFLIPFDVYDNTFLQAVRTRDLSLLVHPVACCAFHSHAGRIPRQVQLFIKVTDPVSMIDRQDNAFFIPFLVVLDVPFSIGHHLPVFPVTDCTFGFRDMGVIRQHLLPARPSSPFRLFGSASDYPPALWTGYVAVIGHADAESMVLTSSGCALPSVPIGMK